MSTSNAKPKRPARKLGIVAWVSSRFAAGLAIALPFIVTIAIIWWVVGFIDGTVVPFVKPALGPKWGAVAESLPGAGALIAVVILTGFGAFAANFIGRFVVKQTERAFNTLPLVKGVYSSAKQIVDTMRNPGGQSFKEAVLLEFPTPGQWSIAFVTNEQPTQLGRAIGQEALVAVYVPSCPIPTSGFLIYAPRSSLKPLGQGPEEALKLVMSAGIVKELPAPPTAATKG
ncbi:MAG: DUF502 domain-containing protein [Caulobacterales bacterium]|jgi:uncharacterized membrane protein